MTKHGKSVNCCTNKFLPWQNYHTKNAKDTEKKRRLNTVKTPKIGVNGL